MEQAAQQAVQEITQIPLWIAVATLVFTAVSAVGAAAAAIANFLVVRTAARTHSSELLLEFTRQYYAPPMNVALKRLADWWRENEHDPQALKNWNEARLKRDEVALELDAARRFVKSYFEAVVRLHKNRFVTRRFAELLTDKDGAGILIKVCEPLDRAINPQNYPKDLFDGVRDLVGPDHVATVIDRSHDDRRLKHQPA